MAERAAASRGRRRRRPPGPSGAAGGSGTRRGRAPEGGVSLLELLVALTVSGVVLVVLLSGFSRNLRATAQARGVTTAVLLARDVMVEAAADDAREGRREGRFEAALEGYAWSVETSPAGALGASRLWRQVVLVTAADGRTVRLETLRLEAAPAE